LANPPLLRGAVHGISEVVGIEDGGEHVGVEVDGFLPDVGLFTELAFEESEV
jgi:hypothetical protein